MDKVIQWARDILYPQKLQKAKTVTKTADQNKQEIIDALQQKIASLNTNMGNVLSNIGQAGYNTSIGLPVQAIQTAREYPSYAAGAFVEPALTGYEFLNPPIAGKGYDYSKAVEGQGFGNLTPVLKEILRDKQSYQTSTNKLKEMGLPRELAYTLPIADQALRMLAFKGGVEGLGKAGEWLANKTQGMPAGLSTQELTPQEREMMYGKPANYTRINPETGKPLPVAGENDFMELNEALGGIHSAYSGEKVEYSQGVIQKFIDKYRPDLKEKPIYEVEKQLQQMYNAYQKPDIYYSSVPGGRKEWINTAEEQQKAYQIQKAQQERMRATLSEDMIKGIKEQEAMQQPSTAKVASIYNDKSAAQIRAEQIARQDPALTAYEQAGANIALKNKIALQHIGDSRFPLHDPKTGGFINNTKEAAAKIAQQIQGQVKGASTARTLDPIEKFNEATHILDSRAVTMKDQETAIRIIEKIGKQILDKKRFNSLQKSPTQLRDVVEEVLRKLKLAKIK